MSVKVADSFIDFRFSPHGVYCAACRFVCPGFEQSLSTTRAGGGKSGAPRCSDVIDIIG
jgi:hypothetical protein